MDTFEKKSLLELRKLSLEELEEYYLRLRKYEFENNIPLKNIKLRRSIFKILLSIIKVDRIIAKEKIKVLSDESVKTDKPIIYACTHIGGNDIQRCFEAINKHAYLFLGDPKDVYRDVNGLILGLNGVICLETSNKEDRHIAKERAVELLKKGGNLLIYPEGAWNITDALPVMKLYKGTAQMALETGAEIVPVAIEQYNNQFLVKIGKNLRTVENEDATMLTERLRDSLATLRWDIWESQTEEKRENITEEYMKRFKQSIVDKCEYGYTIQDVFDTMYKDRNETTIEEAFSFVENLRLNPKNSFMLANPNRLVNYIDVCSRVDEIEQKLLAFRSTQEETLPIGRRLAKYKEKKMIKNK